jgi:filamentous hemagglutinin family protein
MTRSMSHKCRTSIRASTLALAAALVAGPSPAAAQSFVGTHSATGATVDQSTPGQTNVTVAGQQAVINWTATNNPSDGTIVFQPDGTTATFTGASNFAVLNRITPGTAGSAIYMGGNINSLIGGEITGGTVFFYSPNGIIIGQNAAINVGSLGLTTLPIADDGNGNWMTGFGTTDPQVTFGQATDPNSFIRTDAVIDGSIRSNGAGSYVALVAPQITHRGVIRTDGAAALVAAEAATITFSPDGLFNIQVNVGTDAATGIHVDGGTIDRNSAVEANGNVHRAYLVAMAKNDAVTMLIDNGGSVGFDTATSAAIGEDNVVVLSGGGNVFFGTPSVGGSAVPVNLGIDSSSFSSDVHASISGGADIRTGNGNTSFDRDLTLFASADSIIAATNGNSLAIGETLFANVDEFGTGPATTGNELRVTAIGDGSTLTVGGNAFLSATAYGAGDGEGIDPGDATGGTVILQTGSGSTIDIDGNLDIAADGFGGNVSGFDAAAGDGTGGQVHILANGGSGSSLTVDGLVTVSATGHGGGPEECSACLVTGGNGTGGTILLQALTGTGNVLTFNGNVELFAGGQGGAGDVAGGNGFGGTIQLASGDSGSIVVVGNLDAEASARGGFGLDNDVSGGLGGNGTGGNISTLFQGAASTIEVQGNANFNADGSGGDGVNGGNGTGGWVNLQAAAGGMLTAPFLGASADGFGGSGFSGGTGTGGRSWVQAITGGDIVLDDLSLSAEGIGGDGVETRAGGSGATGGNAVGGYVVASANGTGSGLTVANTLDQEAGARGGFGSTASAVGGNALGGQADIFAAGNGTVTLNGFVSADATGRGGNYFTDDSTGGNGTGGIIFFQASNGATLDAANEVLLTSDGIGGFSFGDCTDCGGTGGDGTGGTVTVQAFGGAGALVSVGSELNATANGFGSSGFAGPGGDGQGGTVRMAIHSGTEVEILGDLFLTASGNGGWQTDGGAAGSGTGGLVEAFIETTGGTLTVSGVTGFDASGFGGQVLGTGGTGGSALGGVARYVALGGTATFSDLDIQADAIGGSTESGTGGNAQSGRARIFANGGAVVVGADLTLTSISTGGSGDNGGDAIAFIGNDPRNTSTSDARIVAGNGSVTVGGVTTLDVHADGGAGANGGTGGDASGGYATVHAVNRDAGSGIVTLGDLLIDAEANGGAGGDGTSGNGGTAGGNGGSATGGFVAVTASAGNGELVIGTVGISASAFGGNGGTGGSGDSLAGGNAGDGGVATGGTIFVGTESANAEALGANDGSARFAAVTAIANATGGNGGGFSFGTPNGLAGDGGDAFGGLVVLQARGAPVDVGDGGGTVLFSASATGGDGGLDANDAYQGSGGDAVTGSVGVIATNRSGEIDQRGTIDAGDVIALASATGGNGLVGGGQWTQGGSTFQVINSDVTIGTLSILVAADGLDPNAAETSSSPVTVINGDATIAGGFSFTTPGLVSVHADDGSLSAASITIAADNFIHDDARPLPASLGTLDADMFNLTTNGDLIIDAHLDSATGLELFAPGSVATGNVKGNGFDVLVEAQGGSIEVGDVDGADVFLTAASDLSAGRIDADGIDARAGGMATLNGVWSAPFVTLWSDDIDIAAGGGIDAGTDGSITLVSTHEDGALIGDGLTGSGYALSNAEFGRISGGDLTIVAGGLPGSGADMLIGDLTITGPNAGSTIESETGGVTFITAAGGEGLDGTLRIVGDVGATGFGAENYLEFLTENFELDAATGSLSIEDAPGALSGQLFIEAAHIHVASGEILDQLTEDPQYEGYREDLNAPADVQRPEGVVRAGSIEVEFGDAGEGELNTLYVQNSGTSDTPAGFLVTDAVLFGDDGESIPPPASIDVVINGQIETEGGTLTGIEVRDALVEAEEDLTPFTANSTVNGCLLTGGCDGPEPPGPLFPPGFTPTPGIQDEVELIDDGLLPPPEFGNEDFIDDNDGSTFDGATSPIKPPQPLFDSSGLAKKGDVDDPVSGSGNPALMETATCAADGSSPAGQCKQEKQP